MLEIEVGEDETPQTCHCCGEVGSSGHGFVYENGDAHAVYYAAWSDAHPERGVSLAIALGEWSDDSTPADRTCVGIQAFEGERDVHFRFVEPEDSPWPNTDLLGPMLRRDLALHHDMRQHFLKLAELVVLRHPAVCRAVGVS